MRKLFINKNKKGFAMAELLAVSIVLLFIFSILFSNYLPLVAEYETRLSYNDVTAQYAAHYIRKMYKEALVDDALQDQFKNVKSGTVGYMTVYKKGDTSQQSIYNHIGTVANPSISWADSSEKKELKKKEIENVINEYGIEEIIITRYKLEDVKANYSKGSGSLYNYIKYLPNYEKSIYTGNEQDDNSDQLYRIILKTKDYGYATTPILYDYNTPGSCFEGEKKIDGTLKITKYLYNEDNGCGNIVTIKNSSVKLAGGETGIITEIGDKVFSIKSDSAEYYPAYNVKQIILLSNNVNKIGNSAFEGSELESLPDLENVASIGDSAFAKTKITEADLNDYPSSSTIGDYAFSSNENLVTVKLPTISTDSLTSITVGDYAFAYNKKLLTVELSNANIYSFNNDDSGNKSLAEGLFAESGTDASGTDASGIKVKIPAKMRNIGDKMFYLSNISMIDLTEGVETIGDRAFSQWDNEKNTGSSINSLSFPNTVTTIGESSFDYLKITNVTFDVGLKSIGKYAFRNGGISVLDFGDNESLTDIGEKSFTGNNIVSVTLPASVERIGNSAFSMNNNLKNVTLPENSDEFKIISDSLFYGCGQLEDVKIPNSVIRINNDAFNVTDASGASGNRLSKVTINENSNLTYIGERAFYGQANLSELNIPKNVNNIQNNAFGECGKLTQINNYSSVDFTTRGCLIFYNASTCDITNENNNVYINYSGKAQKTITNMKGGATNG